MATEHYSIPEANRNSGFLTSDWNAALQKIDAEMWKIPQYRANLTNANNANDLSGSGFWLIQGTVPTNVPSDATWSMLFQFVVGTVIQQYIIKPVSGIVYIREYSGSPATWYSWKSFGKWTEITSQFTVNTTYCRDFHAYTDGHQVYFSCYAKAGTPDQTNIVTNITSGYRPITVCAASTFWMNWGDASKSIAAYVMTSAIQIRTVGDLEGSSGVLVSGSYPI